MTTPTTPRPHTPLPWTGRQMTAHFAIEAANGVRVAEVNYIGRPDGSTTEDDVDLIVEAVNAYDRLRAEHAEMREALAALVNTAPPPTNLGLAAGPYTLLQYEKATIAARALLAKMEAKWA